METKGLITLNVRGVMITTEKSVAVLSKRLQGIVDFDCFVNWDPNEIHQILNYLAYPKYIYTKSGDQLKSFQVLLELWECTSVGILRCDYCSDPYYIPLEDRNDPHCDNCHEKYKFSENLSNCVVCKKDFYPSFNQVGKKTHLKCIPTKKYCKDETCLNPIIGTEEYCFMHIPYVHDDPE